MSIVHRGIGSVARVLLVEDDAASRELGGVLLGGEARLACGPEEALRRLSEEPFVRVISDLNLGDAHRDGLWVLEQVRRLQPAAERWLTTADPDHRVGRALGTGLASRLVPKPWRGGALLGA